MLRSPTVEKLQALHLHGLLAAWEAQERSPDAAEIPFAARLGPKPTTLESRIKKLRLQRPR